MRKLYAGLFGLLLTACAPDKPAQTRFDLDDDRVFLCDRSDNSASTDYLITRPGTQTRINTTRYGGLVLGTIGVHGVTLANDRYQQPNDIARLLTKVCENTYQQDQRWERQQERLRRF